MRRKKGRHKSNRKWDFGRKSCRARRRKKNYGWIRQQRNDRNLRRKRDRERNDSRKGNHDSGYQNEHRVELALIRNKHLLPLIEGCHNAFKNGELDVRGIDIIVALRNGFCLLLQVKSSPNGLAKHYKNHPLIPAFVAERSMSDNEIAMAVMEVVRRQAKFPFDIGPCYYGGRSKELKWLGADMLVVLRNGFGLFLKREGGEDYADKDRHCWPMPTIEIPDSWDVARITEELRKIIEARRKQFFETGDAPQL